MGCIVSSPPTLPVPVTFSAIIIYSSIISRRGLNMGVPVCASCKKKQKPGDVFHTIPITNAEIFRRWQIAARINATSRSMLCADHFEPDAYLYNDSKRLKADAVPTIFAHTSNPRKPPTKRTLECDDEKPAKTMKIDARPVPASPSKDELRELLIKKDVCIAEKK